MGGSELAGNQRGIAVWAGVRSFEGMTSRKAGADWDERFESGETPWDKGYGAPPLAEFLDRQLIEGREEMWLLRKKEGLG